MKKKFYITTPIYYPSAKPHMGHAYSSISADILARYKRIEGYHVKFLTGTDEHGSKIQKSAEAANQKPIEFCDSISQIFLELTKTLNLSNTDFIRTTESRHKIGVQKLWNILEKKQLIYLSKYSGWYSISDESYYTEEETIINNEKNRVAITTGSTVEWLEEESYFFKLSNWQNKLLDFYNENTDFIQPLSRRNEVISFVKSGLKDLSISRTSFNWGVQVPGNDRHIIYVWLDALSNYLTATNFFENQKEIFWPADLHIIGKDILRFHAVYWPAFLMAADIPLPKQIFAHGWILSGEEKMSKSKGNILDPVQIINDFGVDEVRYYLMKEVIYGSDGKINLDNLKNCINSDLANNLGNLSQRIFSLISKNYNNKIPQPSTFSNIDSLLVNFDLNFILEKIKNFEIHNCIKDLVAYSSKINKYVNDEEPWNKNKNTDKRISTIIYVSIECLRRIFIMLYPVIPSKSKKFLECLQIREDQILLDNLNKKLSPGTDVKSPGLLFKKYL